MKVTQSVLIMFMVLPWYNNILQGKCPQMLQTFQDCKNCIDSQKSNDLCSISKALGKYDVLIVFSSVVDKKNKRSNVVELYKRGNRAAKVYNLFGDALLATCIDSNNCFYCGTELYKLVWQPIEDELEGMKNIYFIPNKLLSNIPLEYCVDKNGRMFAEKYNVFRLSSSSVLKEHGRKKNYSRISIWGGIDFYADLPKLTKYEYADTTSVFKCSIGYLEDSYRAAVLINDEVQQQGVVTESYYDETATEERFKSQQWNAIDIFFIETHGLFLNNYNTVNSQDKEDPMENHALALAGASYVLEGGIVPDSINDGILTAREIAELDMSNVELAVISACKSALGEIREDGVYGLMRGFKQAGVKSLIMTTDDIVDYVSGQLWIQLFRNMAKGMSKREALLEGLTYIRTMDDGAFSHPKFWTPFILIDGLE